jgi:hypothetical protein
LASAILSLETRLCNISSTIFMNYYQLYVTSFITREVSFKAMNIWNRIRETSLRSSILLRISSYFACSSFLSSFAFVTSSTALQSCW